MSKLDIEIAEREVTAWLDYKKVNTRRRENFTTQIKSLAEAVSEGELILDTDSMVFTQPLKFEIGDELKIKELKFQPRADIGKLSKAMQGVGAQDTIGMLNAYASALTGQSKEVLKKLDSEDGNITNAIAIFFIPT